MVPRCRLLLLAAVLSAAVTAAGCDDLQGERRCPGESCSPELASLVEAVAGLPAVTRVEEAVSSWGLDNGTYLEVSLRADVSTRSVARRLARRVVETAGAAEAGPAEVVDVLVDSGRVRTEIARFETSGALPPAALRRRLETVAAGWPVTVDGVSARRSSADLDRRSVARLSLVGVADADLGRGVAGAVTAALQGTGPARGGRTIVVLHYRTAAPYCFRTVISTQLTGDCPGAGVAG